MKISTENKIKKLENYWIISKKNKVAKKVVMYFVYATLLYFAYQVFVVWIILSFDFMNIH